MSRYVIKVGVAFAVGGVIGVLGIMLFPFSTISYAIGGGISGASLGRGWRPAIGFGLGVVFLGFIVPLMMVAFQGMGSNTRKDWEFGITAWSLMYAIGGGIGSAVSGLGWKIALIGPAAFGAAGAIAFAAIMISFDIFTGALESLAFFVAPVIPHVLGGALLAVALYPSHKRTKCKKLGLCLKCGYDLRGSIERCPECGEPIASISSQSDA